MGIESYQTTIYYIKCDNCIEEYMDLEMYEDEDYMKNEALALGWTESAEGDWLCPKCNGGNLEKN